MTHQRFSAPGLAQRLLAPIAALLGSYTRPYRQKP